MEFDEQSAAGHDGADNEDHKDRWTVPGIETGKGEPALRAA